ncbi:MAG TPA: UvrB/UvrC motif-containing protein [Planctomycetota bacterium]|nr:UvrB/UvrC motif-containing protein [Planctomycetota bacterium]
MAVDVTSIFDEWKHDASDESKNVRCIRGHDGRLKIQVRVRCGIFQWEFEGRPDGSTPHGCPSLLEHYRVRLRGASRRRGARAALRLSKAQVEEISEEIMDYYQRRVLFFRLGEYERARNDAQHNLDLLDILRSHGDDSEAVAEHEKWRAFVMMDRTRAEALALCQNGAYPDAVHTIDRGIAEVADVFRKYGREDVIPISQEIATLKELKLQLREAYSIPLTREEILDGLREQQAKAIADEDYERAAHLRDEIAQFEKGEEQKAT